MMWLKGTSENKFMKLLWQLKHLGWNMCVWNMKDCRKLEEEARHCMWARRLNSGSQIWFLRRSSFRATALVSTFQNVWWLMLSQAVSPEVAIPCTQLPLHTGPLTCWEHSVLCTSVQCEGAFGVASAFAQKFARLCSPIDVLVLWIFSPGFHPLSPPPKPTNKQQGSKESKYLNIPEDSLLFSKNCLSLFHNVTLS